MPKPNPNQDTTGAAAAFDFEAFITGTDLQRDSATVYRVDRSQEIARLQAEHDAIPAGTSTAGDERESDAGTISSDRVQIAEQIAALRDEMAASRVEFEFRDLTPDELKQCLDAAQAGDDDMYLQVSLQSSSHGGWKSPNELTAEQWRKVANAVGTSQWNVIMACANGLINKRVAVPDFSPSVSKTLAQRVSFAS